MQPFQRPHAVLGKRALDFGFGLVKVHVHREIELRGERCYMPQGVVSHGIGRVRRKTKRRKRLLATRVAQRKPFAEIVVRIGGVRRGKVDHDQADGDPHRRF